MMEKLKVPQLAGRLLEIGIGLTVFFVEIYFGESESSNTIARK
jgi:hypothetical protein